MTTNNDEEFAKAQHITISALPFVENFDNIISWIESNQFYLIKYLLGLQPSSYGLSAYHLLSDLFLSFILIHSDLVEGRLKPEKEIYLDT